MRWRIPWPGEVVYITSKSTIEDNQRRTVHCCFAWRFPRRSKLISLQYEYTAELLCLVAIGFSKVAMLCFFLRITPQRTQRLLCYALVATCAAWTIAVVATAATRCRNDNAHELLGEDCDDYVSISKHGGLVQSDA